MFKSEIRQSTINELLEKAANKNFGQYLAKLVMKKVRGFSEVPIVFDFPVTAIIGPNGGGKTTVLGSAACAYKDIQPRRFFAKSGKYDESMQDWAIEYELVDRTINARDTFRRSANFKSSRWRRDAPARSVLLFDVSRTMPVNERKEFLKCASSSFQVPDQNISAFSEDVVERVSRILGKDVRNFKKLEFVGGAEHLLSGATSDQTAYSEFHFGAGESSVIRMVLQIEEAPENTIVLIEEIENGLHPVATIRLVEYLIEAAKRKKIQVIFTTHSNEALLPLPAKAIWAATQDRVFQGKLDVNSLRAITGQITKSLVIFVEDQFAKAWLEALIREAGEAYLDNVEVHAMEGDGSAVVANKYHNENPAIDIPSICIIDGDSSQTDNDEARVYRLPGEAPETCVFDGMMEKWGQWGGALSVALYKKYEDQANVKAVCEEVRRQNMDPHLLFQQLGMKLGFIPEETVRGAFCAIWAQANTEYRDTLATILKEYLPE